MQNPGRDKRGPPGSSQNCKDSAVFGRNGLVPSVNAKVLQLLQEIGFAATVIHNRGDDPYLILFPKWEKAWKRSPSHGNQHRMDPAVHCPAPYLVVSPSAAPSRRSLYASLRRQSDGLTDCPANNAIEPENHLRAVIGLLLVADYEFTTFGAAFTNSTLEAGGTA